jgi:putative transcriptional regulator
LLKLAWGNFSLNLKVAATAATEARLKLGVYQSAFAQLLGVSVRTLQEWEQGRREPSGAAQTLLRIALKSPEAILQAVDFFL